MVDSLEGKGESRNEALAFGEVGRKNVGRRELWLMLASVPSRGGYWKHALRECVQKTREM